MGGMGMMGGMMNNERQDMDIFQIECKPVQLKHCP
jgi:hypothetical protein